MITMDLPALDYELSDEGTKQAAESVVTLRMPRKLHVQLMTAAKAAETSLNTFCLSKLIAQIDDCPIIPQGLRATKEKFIEERNRRLELQSA